MSQQNINAQKVSLPVTMVGALLVAALAAAAAYYGAIRAQADEMSNIKTDVKVIQQVNQTQDLEIDAIGRKIDRMDKNIVKLLIKNGIQSAE